jgi:hypothetical protein
MFTLDSVIYDRYIEGTTTSIRLIIFWETKHGYSTTLYRNGFAHFIINSENILSAQKKTNKQFFPPNDRKVFVLMLCILKLEKEEGRRESLELFSICCSQEQNITFPIERTDETPGYKYFRTEMYSLHTIQYKRTKCTKQCKHIHLLYLRWLITQRS